MGSGDVPQNLAMLRAAFGSGPLYAPTDDDLITLEGVGSGRARGRVVDDQVEGLAPRSRCWLTTISATSAEDMSG